KSSRPRRVSDAGGGGVFSGPDSISATAGGGALGVGDAGAGVELAGRQAVTVSAPSAVAMRLEANDWLCMGPSIAPVDPGQPSAPCLRVAVRMGKRPAP